MTTFLWILASGVLRSAVALVGSVTFLLPFTAGNFLYTAASDLVPEVNRDHGLPDNVYHAASFAAGVALLYGIRVAFAA